MSFIKNEEQNSFWRNKKVLVTGANGFVGQRLIYFLKKINAKVFSVTSKNGSVEDFSNVDNLIKKNDIKIVFHLAAQSVVELGQQQPIKTFEVNIKGTWNVLEASRVNKVDKVIVASTAHVYGNNPNLPFKESYFPRPSRPYETSKACADLLAQCYADSFDLSVEIPRFVNLYGPGDLNFTRLIPGIIKKITDGKNPKVWDMGAVRDFLFIDDAINAYLLLAEQKASSKGIRVINFGSGKPIEIVDLVERIIKLIGNPKIKIDLIKSPKQRAREVLKQYVSIEKAKKELNWQPKVSLDDGLKETIEWYRKFFKA